MSLLKATTGVSAISGRQGSSMLFVAVNTSPRIVRHTPFKHTAAQVQHAPRRVVSTRASAGDGQQQKVEFGYSRKDVVIIGAGLIGLGYALYYGLQAMGMEAGMAGNWVQLIIFLGICVGWVGSYVYRVSTKQMTYVKQLENYEQAVMQKRLEEMTETELQQLMTEVDNVKEGKKGSSSQ